MRLIDADALKNSVKRQTSFVRLIGGDFEEIADVLEKGFLQEIENAPTIEERKTGKWIYVMTEDWCTFDECKCSVCGTVEYFNKGWKKFSYCPNCGCAMKGEDDEN